MSWGTCLFVVAPVVLAAWLIFREPDARRFEGSSAQLATQLLAYAGLTCTLIAAALWLVARASGARMLVTEIPVVGWFVLTWQLAWLVWSRALSTWVRPARYALTCLVFVPAFAATVLTYKCKQGDGRDPMTALGVPFVRAQVTTRDGMQLQGWYVAQPGAERTIVIGHGAGANKGDFVWYLRPLLHHGYNLAMFDFRAHGESDGRVTTWGVRESEDVLAVVDWLERAHPAEARRIVGLGSSQGALALMRAGVEEPRIDAFVLDSAFRSPRDLALAHARALPWLGPPLAEYMLLWMSAWSGVNLRDRSAAAKIAALGRRPVLVIHGDADQLAPRTEAQRLFEEARGPREIWFGPGTHSNVITAAPRA